MYDQREYENIDRDTASSAAAYQRRNIANTNATLLKNDIYAEKYNTERDLLNKDTYSQQVKCLTFAYKQNLNNPKMEGRQVTYMEKYKFLESRLADVFPKDENDCINFTLCDFSDDSVVIYCWSEGKHYKIDYFGENLPICRFSFINAVKLRTKTVPHVQAYATE